MGEGLVQLEASWKVVDAKLSGAASRRGEVDSEREDMIMVVSDGWTRPESEVVEYCERSNG